MASPYDPTSSQDIKKKKNLVTTLSKTNTVAKLTCDDSSHAFGEDWSRNMNDDFVDESLPQMTGDIFSSVDYVSIHAPHVQ